MSNKRILKAYERYDGSGRVVAGSLVLRDRIPKNGRWREVEAYECCNPVVLYYTPASYPIANPNVELLCNNLFIDNAGAIGLTANNINELVTILNDETGTSNFGYYAAQSNGSVRLTVPDTVKEQYCPTGTLSFTITPD